jgi:signal transduction histidine kinase
MKRPFRSLLPILAVALAAPPLAAGPAQAATAAERFPPEHQETRDLIALVADAGALIAEKGVQGACVEFSREGSRWRQGERYVFIIGLDGNALCHPAKPSLEGQSVLDLHDPHGQAIVRNFLRDVAGSRTEGWEHYLWPAPGQNTFYWKTSYVRRAGTPDGREVVVGSGDYQMKVERFFIADKVDQAVELIATEGEAAFPELRSKSGGFRFYDSYLFVMDSGGVQLVNAAFPENEGKNLLDLKDTNGKVIGREMLAVLADADSGWVDYMWPRPGDKPASQKSSYVRKVTLGDKTLVVGAGYYRD